MADKKLLDATTASLKRIQDFDSSTLPRMERLGQDFEFGPAVEPANRLIGLFRQFPEQFLPDLPDSSLNNLKTHADSTFNFFEQIMKFESKQPEAYQARLNLIQSLTSHYDSVFLGISPLISYAGTRLRDFSAIEAQGRAAVQAATDEAGAAAAALKAQKEEAEKILADVRKVAAEAGVSQQSFYFQTETDKCETDAETWRVRTRNLAILLGVYAVLSLFVHKFIVPSSNYEAIQLGLSKVLIFVVIGFMLVLSARNFLANKHNAVVNRHRNNALLTFKALADAAGAEESRDIVLTYASSCIFSPQETGYTKAGDRTEIAPNIVQAIPKIASGTVGS